MTDLEIPPDICPLRYGSSPFLLLQTVIGLCYKNNNTKCSRPKG